MALGCTIPWGSWSPNWTGVFLVGNVVLKLVLVKSLLHSRGPTFSGSPTRRTHWMGLWRTGGDSYIYYVFSYTLFGWGEASSERSEHPPLAPLSLPPVWEQPSCPSSCTGRESNYHKWAIPPPFSFSLIYYWVLAPLVKVAGEKWKKNPGLEGKTLQISQFHHFLRDWQVIYVQPKHWDVARATHLPHEGCNLRNRAERKQGREGSCEVLKHWMYFVCVLSLLDQSGGDFCVVKATRRTKWRSLLGLNYSKAQALQCSRCVGMDRAGWSGSAVAMLLSSLQWAFYCNIVRKWVGKSNTGRNKTQLFVEERRKTAASISIALHWFASWCRILMVMNKLLVLRAVISCQAGNGILDACDSLSIKHLCASVSHLLGTDVWLSEHIDGQR